MSFIQSQFNSFKSNKPTSSMHMQMPKRDDFLFGYLLENLSVCREQFEYKQNFFSNESYMKPKFRLIMPNENPAHKLRSAIVKRISVFKDSDDMVKRFLI